MEPTRKQIYEMGHRCMQLGLANADEVERLVSLGARVEWRLPLLKEASRQLGALLNGIR